jgi:hypothetical protein
MSLNLKDDYLKVLRSAKPIVIPPSKIHPPPGALGAIKIIPEVIIPPLNTDIRFDMLPQYNIKKYPGLAALDDRKLPENFSWGIEDSNDSIEIKNKKRLITKPPNQMLCGSCWAISSAGVLSDNFVVSGVVDWYPNISTTYSLACYSQGMCKGGNPALLLQTIQKKGIVSNNCIDYSWCATNESCNGSGTKHFSVDMSELVPDCGCISNREHLLYKLDNLPEVITVDDEENQNIYVNTVKKHIYQKGSVVGGYIVFRNFMDGRFTHINNGVYFENGIYDSQQIQFDESQSSSDKFMGCHAISIIGWGVAKNTIVDNKGNRKDVPYWHCRNSWGEKWGDNGYFKMAMYPYNKVAQFDKFVQITSPNGQQAQNAGIIMCSVSSPPVLTKIEKIPEINFQLLHEKSYYDSDDTKKVIGIKTSGENKNLKNNKKIFLILFILIIVIIIIVLLYLKYKK